MASFKTCFTFVFLLVFGPIHSQNLTDSQFLDSVNTAGILPNIENRTFVGVKLTNGDYDFDYFGWYSSIDSTVQKDDWYVHKIDKNAIFTVLDFEQTFNDAFLNKGKSSYLDHNDYPLRMDELSVALRFREMGNDSLAIACLSLVNDNMYARTNNAAFKNMKEDLAWSIYSDMLSYHLTGDFEMAYQYAEIYKKQYSSFKVPFPGNEVVQDLERRKVEGQFEKVVLDSLPIEFARWDMDKKMNFLISNLDQINIWSSMFVTDLSIDWRAKELVKLGQVVVEPMLGLMESDKRLTRSIHSQRDFCKWSKVRGVEEVALNVIEAVLHKQFHSLPHTSCTYTTSYKEESKDLLIKRIRKYYEENKGFTVEESLYNRLNNPQVSLRERKEAFEEFVNMPHKNPDGSITTFYGEYSDELMNPVIDQFRNPSVAELGLLLCQEQIKILDSTKKDYRRNVIKIHNDFSRKLVRLHDSNINSKISEFINTCRDAHIKIIWAQANSWFNKYEDRDNLISEIKNKNILYKRDLKNSFSNNYVDSEGLRAFINLSCMFASETANKLINSFCDKKHVFYPEIQRSIFDSYYVGQSPLLDAMNSQSFDINFYKSLLGNRTIVGQLYYGGVAAELKSPFINGSKSHYYDLNEIAIIERKEFYDSIDVTYDLWALHKLSTLVLGMPTYHPLEKRLDSSKQAVLNFLSKNYELRKMNYREYREMSDETWGAPTQYIPIINLEKAATKKDFKKGEALFCLENKKAVKIKNVDKYLMILINGYEVKAMVLQAEQLEGIVYFGVVSQYGTQIVTKRMGQTKYF